jgi:hypothetical protein
MLEPSVNEVIAHERLNSILLTENSLLVASQDGLLAVWEKPSNVLRQNRSVRLPIRNCCDFDEWKLCCLDERLIDCRWCSVWNAILTFLVEKILNKSNCSPFQMSDVFIVWPGEKTVEKVFTSLRLFLWSAVASQLVTDGCSRFFVMSDRTGNEDFLRLLAQMNLLVNETMHFLPQIDDHEKETIERALRASPLMSFEDDKKRLLLDQQQIENDFLLKTSTETTGKQIIGRFSA